MKEQLFHDAAEPHLITAEPKEMQQFIDHRLTDLSRLTMCSAAPTTPILAQPVLKSKLYRTDDIGDDGYSQLSPKRTDCDVAINSHSSIVHPVEPDISTNLLSKQRKDERVDNNENGNKAATVTRDVSVTVNALSMRQLSPIKRDMSPTLSQTITDQRKKSESVIYDVLVTADALPSHHLSPIRRNMSPATKISPSITDQCNKSVYDVCSRAVPISPDRPIPLILPASPVLANQPDPILPVPLTLPDLVLLSKVDEPVMNYSTVTPVKPVPSMLSIVQTTGPISARPANDTPTSTTTKRCASVTAALTAAAAATAATKRLTARNKLICLSSSMDIDDKPPHEFMSLSLSPPMNRRREMPALRGPFVSL